MRSYQRVTWAMSLFTPGEPRCCFTALHSTIRPCYCQRKLHHSIWAVWKPQAPQASTLHSCVRFTKKLQLLLSRPTDKSKGSRRAMSSTAGTMAGASSCVTLAGHIIELLMTSKGNKEEFRSLLVAVQGIYSFLKELPEDGITPQGTIVLRQLHANLLPAKRLLSEVARMGPLMSLIKANVVRDEFLRINRDITSTFSLLAAGEQLLDLARSRSQQMKDAEQIRRQLLSCDSDFFADEAAALGRLQDVAAAGQQGGWSEQKLQRRLLDQLQPEVACMQPDELLAEFKALQMLVMYNGAGGGVQQQGDSKGKKDVDAQTEEFLVQQVCAALAATVASTTAGPLQPEAAASPPADFLCPISQQLMVDPAVLVETGHSYEAANICRWLDTHGTCPITRQQLHSKQLVPNISLRKAIADWAASHGRIMPPAPVYKSLHSDTCGDSGGGAPCVSDAAAAVDQYQERRSSGFTAAAAANGTGVSAATGSQDPFIVSMAGAAGHRGAGRNFGHRGAGRNSSKSAFQCSRTRWAVGIVALLLVAGGIAAGVGIFFTVRRNKQASTPSSGVPVPASMGGLETKGNSDSNNTSTGQGALGGQCAPLGKCNIPLIEGGCECDANCACRPGRGADNCDKCNIWAREGGCKCDDKCDCRPGLGADKCDKCRMQYSDGGCPGASGPRCDVNCDCL